MANEDRPLVHLVDDEAAIRRSAGFMLKSVGYRVETYESGVELLKRDRRLEPGCILLDVRMPEMDGLEVQQALGKRGIAFPVVVMTGHGDISVAVRAMKAGAVDFLEKPFEKAALLASLEEGFARLRRAEARSDRQRAAEVSIAALTPREREVLEGLAQGLPNKSIAYDLGISPRTVEIHRANLMDKLAVRSLSEALRLAFAAGMGGGAA